MTKKFEAEHYRSLLRRQAEELRNVAQTFRERTLRDRLERIALEISRDEDDHHHYRLHSLRQIVERNIFLPSDDEISGDD